MIRLPEGIRRVCVVAGILINVVLIVQGGQTLSEWMELPPSQLAFRLGAMVVIFFLPFIACMIFYWIKAGFAKDSAR
ncbi:hypothetical protein ACNFBR_21210 [Pseudomonas sp. NY11955]|uniref:hypothetical protein n=1 Tax=Pseudomonas sp. NY11955 TaxID=3400363 RepID=UPI003A88672F